MLSRVFKPMFPKENFLRKHQHLLGFKHGAHFSDIRCGRRKKNKKNVCVTQKFYASPIDPVRFWHHFQKLFYKSLVEKTPFTTSFNSIG